MTKESGSEGSHYERKNIPPYGSKDPNYWIPVCTGMTKKERFQTVPYTDILRATGRLNAHYVFLEDLATYMISVIYL